MKKSKLVQEIETIISPVLIDMGVELVDIQYLKEGGRWILRIFIDQPGGVGLEDCQRVSERIDPLLDEKDPIPQSYYLEVSSPGLDRPLKKLADYERFTGSEVNVTTYGPVHGKRKFKGRLIAASSHAIILESGGNNVELPMEQIASARLVPVID